MDKEIQRELDRQESKICRNRDDISRVEGSVSSLEVKQGVAETILASHSQKLDNIIDNNKWILRIVVAWVLVEIMTKMFS